MKLNDMTLAQRIELATNILRTVSNELRNVYELNAINRHLIYGKRLPDLVDHSRLANSFQVIRYASYQYEITRIVALWDGFKPNRNSIPTIRKLLDHPDIWPALLANHAQRSPYRTGFDELCRLEKTYRYFCLANKLSDRVLSSEDLAIVKNFRHKFAAHSLIQTDLEIKRSKSREGIVPNMRYGLERPLIRKAQFIIWWYYMALESCDFSFSQSKSIAKKNASEFFGKMQFFE